MGIKLRKIKEKDLKMIMDWRTSPHITKYMYTDPNLTLEKQKKWFNNILNSEKVIYWVISCDNNDVGLLNLYDIDYKNKKCGWAYYIADKNFRGKGLSKNLELNLYKFVFETLGLNKLWCEVFSFNDKVIILHKLYGSEKEAIFKDHIYKNGEFHDVVRLAILKNKWFKIKDNYNFENIDIEYKK
jgi:hypothetical protein